MLSVEDNDYVIQVHNLIQNTNDINKPEHIAVINFKQFLKFLGLFNGILSKEEKETFVKFNNIISLSLDSLDSDDKLKELIELSYYYRNLLSEL